MKEISLIENAMKEWAKSEEAINYGYYLIDDYFEENYTENIQIHDKDEAMDDILNSGNSIVLSKLCKKRDNILCKVIDSMDVDEAIKEIIKDECKYGDNAISECIDIFWDFLYENEEIDLYLDYWIAKENTFSFYHYIEYFEDEEERESEYEEELESINYLYNDWVLKRRKRISDEEFRKQQAELKNELFDIDFDNLFD